MKTLISKFSQTNPANRSEEKKHLSIIAIFFLILSFILSGSTQLPQQKNLKNNDILSKRLNILEKLESGKAISSEEIRSSFGVKVTDENGIADSTYGEMNERQIWSESHSTPGPFFYKNHDGTDHVIISDSDIKEIHNQLNKSMEELRKEIESFRNSEDFLMIHDELQKWNENFRKELGKMKEELIKSEKASRSKGTIHTTM
jgi:FtsZ-binding cell division protein ZapB